EAEETIKRHHGATHTKAQLADTEARALELEQRLNSQAEIIQSLEEALKAAKVYKREQGEKDEAISQLHAELDKKNEIISKLQADADEQQRKLAKLRGSESETMRLKAVAEQDKGLIDSLEREVSSLREALAKAQSGDG